MTLAIEAGHLPVPLAIPERHRRGRCFLEAVCLLWHPKVFRNFVLEIDF
jgi:hypothetical protein